MRKQQRKRKYSFRRSGAAAGKRKSPTVSVNLEPTNERVPSVNLSIEVGVRTQISTNYLFYKWILTLFFLFVLVISLVQVGRSEKHAIKLKYWPIFLSHWGLIFNFIQAIIGAIIVSHLHRQGQILYLGSSLKRLSNFYRVLHSLSTTLSIFITFAFWAILYNEDTLLDFISFFTHTFNTMLMSIDYLITDVSYYLTDVMYPVTLAFVYILFTVIYYWCGGEDGKGHSYIYKAIDWKQPKHTLALLSTFMVGIVIVYTSLWTVSIIKTNIIKLVRKGFRRKKSRLRDIV